MHSFLNINMKLLEVFSRKVPHPYVWVLGLPTFVPTAI